MAFFQKNFFQSLVYLKLTVFYKERIITHSLFVNLVTVKFRESLED